MQVIDLSSDAELASITTQHEWVVVKFSAVWCEPCQTMEPIFNQVVTDRASLQAIKVNMDQRPDLARTYNIRSIPTLLLFYKGQVAGQLTGLQSELAINEWLDIQKQTTLNA